MTEGSFLGTRAQRSFVTTIVANAIIVLTMVIIAFAKVESRIDTSSKSGYKTIPCYLALFGLATVFELLMALDALHLQNVIQLAGIILFHLALIVFSALEVHEARDALVFLDQNPCINYVGCDGPHTLWSNVEPFLIVVPCILGVSWLVIIFYFRELYSEFGWAVFRVVGADPTLKTMYQWYQIMICLLKFDFFCFAGVTVQLLIIVLQSDTAEFGLTVAAIPIVLILLIMCGFALKREIKWLMFTSLAIMIAAETYFVYKLVRFYEPSSRNAYQTTRATLTVFTIVAFLLLLTTFGVGIRCFNDFNDKLAEVKMHDNHRKRLSGKDDELGERKADSVILE